MNVTIRAQVATIGVAAALSETALPATVMDQFDRAQRHRAALDGLMPSEQALAQAVIAALDDNRDPAADPEVRRVLSATQLTSDDLRGAVMHQLEADVVATLRDNVDAIISGWASACAVAVEMLQGAYAVLGNVNFDDGVSVMNRGAAAPEAWARAQGALALLSAIDSGWVALMNATHLVDIGRMHGALRIVDASYEQWITHRLAGVKPDPWRYVRQGLALSLPTPAGYRDRVQRIAGQSMGPSATSGPSDDQRESRAARRLMASVNTR